MTKELSRREFLKLAIHTSEALVLTACVPKVAKFATETFVPSSTPAVTAKSTETALSPESAIPTELTPADLEKGKWGSYTFVENPAGYYEINGVPEAKFFKDGTAERTVKFKGKQEILTVAFQAISVGENNRLVLGLWEYVNGAWTEAKTNPAPKSVEDTQSFHKLAILLGHEKEQAMIDTIFLARDMAMTKSETYDPASELQGITITYNFKTVENFDVRPKEWQIINWSRAEKGTYIFKPTPTNPEVGYQDLTKLAYARPMQIALSSGWFNLDIYNPDGTPQPPTVHVPIIAMNSDRSLIDLSGLIRLKGITRIAPSLTKENRGKSYSWLLTQPINTNNYVNFDDELCALMVEVNRNYLEKVEMPKLDEDWPLKSLPEELSQTFLTVFFNVPK